MASATRSFLPIKRAGHDKMTPTHECRIPVRRPATEEISGLIERVTFHNSENGFCVLRVKTPRHRDEATVIGSLPSVTAGEWLVAEGWWVRDKEHGLQFEASTLKTVPPTTADEIERYLGSGLVKGIGPVLAKKLVGRFGTDVLAAIEKRPAELQTVDGIGPKRRERIAYASQQAKQVREIMLFLYSQGVSTSRAVRIFKTYGEQAIERVRENPYMLAKDIYGIGFATADQIAQKVGIPKDSLDRARAGIDHVLLEATSDGHCALPLGKLKLAAAKLLGVSEAIVEQALSQMLTSGSLHLEKIGGEPLIFLPHLRKAEEGIAARIKSLAGMPRLYPEIDFDKAVTWCERRTGKILAPSQREALKTVLGNRRAGRGQDDAGQLDSDDPPCQGREMHVVRANGTGGEAARRDHRLGSKDDSPPARNRSRNGSVYPQRIKSARLRSSGRR